MKTRVYFLYAGGHRLRGSVVMRCLQLAEIGDNHLNEDYDFRCVGMPRKGTGAHLMMVRDMRDAVIVLSKSMIQHLDREAFDHLKAHNIAILADWIDKPLRSEFLTEIDLHIASSRTQQRWLQAQMPEAKVAYLTHHADPRLMHLTFTPRAEFGAIYLGHPENVPMPEGLRGDIRMMDAQKTESFSDVLPILPDHNFHYAVRGDRQPKGVCKPFTKGFTAASCASNILVQRDADDVLDYLGADYPYLIADNSEAAIVVGFEKAREEFGSLDWLLGLEIMKSVAARSSAAHVAGELRGIMRDVVGQRVMPLGMTA